jgi:hypothetical protein
LRFSYRSPYEFGGFALQNNRAVSSGDSAFAAEVVTGLSELNPTIKADVNAGSGSTRAVGLVARMQDNGAAYVAVLTRQGDAELWLVHPGGHSFQVLESTATPANATSGTLQFSVSGGATPTLTLSFNGTTLLSYSPTGGDILESAGGVGIFAWGAGGTLGNFSVTGW